MPITHLSSASSLNPGSDLWIIPDFETSNSAQRLDWYMNFQITKSALHKTFELSSELKNLLLQCNLPEVRYNKKDSDTILFHSSPLLPNRWLVQINNCQDHAKWVQLASKLWLDFQKPSFRVFLPTGLSTQEFSKKWLELHSFDDFSLVVD